MTSRLPAPPVCMSFIIVSLAVVGSCQGPVAANRLSSDLRRRRLIRRLFAQRIVTDEFVTIADMTRLSLLFSRTAEGLVSSSQFHFCYSFELLCGDLPDITLTITVAGVLVRND